MVFAHVAGFPLEETLIGLIPALGLVSLHQARRHLHDAIARIYRRLPRYHL